MVPRCLPQEFDLYDYMENRMYDPSETCVLVNCLAQSVRFCMF